MRPIFIGCGIVTGSPDLRVVRPKNTAAVSRTASPGSVRMRSVKRMSRLSTLPAVVPGERADGGPDRGREQRDEEATQSDVRIP